MDGTGWMLIGVAGAVIGVVAVLRRPASPPRDRDAAMKAARKAIGQSRRSGRRTRRGGIRGQGYGDASTRDAAGSDSGGTP
ncbi:hypothetical protein [Micromonospora sp. KLBMP9576]|uniref:hypothetical protein n=1 Tax=Micromonospora sp. KLBMP9576 TaxID=3424769 RepID=UPI003D923DD5